MIIDAHVNISPDGNWFNTKIDASINRLHSEMAEAGISKALLISMPGLYANDYIYNLVKADPSKYRGAASIDFSKPITEELDAVFNLGFSAIKIHPRRQNIRLFDSSLDGFWAELNANMTKVIICGYLQMTGSELSVSDVEPLVYERLIKKYPNITFILTHAGCHKVMDVYFLCRSYPNFFTDISYSLNIFTESSFYQDYKFLIKQADKKVLFGSDFLEVKQSDALMAFEKLTQGIPQDKIDSVLFKNATDLFW